MTTLGSHSIFAFRATHSKFTQFTFHFYKYFANLEMQNKLYIKEFQKVNVPPPV
jgi:hypothetical protein